MKVLVTGATGFVGEYVINDLLQKGIDVVATSAQAEKAVTRSWYDQVQYVSYDLSAGETGLLQKFHSPDKIIHLAWSGLPNYKELFHFEKNLPEQYAFIRQLVSEGLTDITITGTCLEYGMKEGELTEDTPTDPTISYPLAKDTLRKFLQQLQTKMEFQLKWIRLFYVYGKGQSEKSLFSQLEAAIGRGETEFNMSPGEQVRDFIPVADAAAMITAISTAHEGSGIFNCASGKPITVKEKVMEYLREKNIHIRLHTGFYSYNDYEPMSFWGSTKKTNR
ncbi:MAG: NAD-dependent epimerase/dehydratase family protein [Bacteroidetes bacterium]|nr:NAD-dependent epimerase/dehydratase family protein [Bacteroidota bacterium]